MKFKELDAVSLTAAYRAGTASPVEAIEYFINHAARCEPQLHALYLFDPETAVTEAQKSASRWRSGRPLGPLDGVPVTIKENIATAGAPMPLGTAASEVNPAPADAPPAQRLREAGAIIIAKTTMPDFGMLSSGLSSFHPLTRNPWDLSKTPGGSSSGAAAAAAAGYAPINLGTDIGGSIRLPAGWCGVFGFKPSNGRVPIDPPYMGRVAGPITRTVADAALAMSVLAQPDSRDHTAAPFPQADWTLQPRDLRGLRIGLLMDAGCGLPVDAETAAAVETAARQLEAEGAIVEPIRPFLTRAMLDGIDRFWRARAWADVRKLSAPRRDAILPFIRAWAEAGSTLSGEDVFDGYTQSVEIRIAAHRASLDWDFILSPTAPVAAFDAELPCPTNDVAQPFEHIAFTLPYNMSDQPAASINCGYTSAALPIGLQIVGRRFDDLGVLEVARAYELCRSLQHTWPAAVC